MIALNQYHILIDIKSKFLYGYFIQYIDDSISLYFNLNNYLMTSLIEVYKAENKIHQESSHQISFSLRMQKQTSPTKI